MALILSQVDKMLRLLLDLLTEACVVVIREGVTEDLKKLGSQETSYE